ncbi:hypothetical protein [Actinomycetospora chibensis]|uniref:Uncharacterized protein n=1 Tax=Actinomycetospora chibensis TaxID=663606 RepID=A0ABV9RM20_9PSEU|nr:hypothetical protein [Actinomycetospora chibensis]MDD7926984.1 hypothetical protein [Actinomycetospora chibensis]
MTQFVKDGHAAPIGSSATSWRVADNGRELPGTSSVPSRKGKVGRAWTQQIEVAAAALRARVQTRLVEIDDSDDYRSAHVTVENIFDLLERACCAARGGNPPRRFFLSWWRGADVEAAFGYLHKAEAEAVRLYDEDEVEAEIPAAISRVEVALQRDDPVRIEARKLLEPNGRGLRTLLKKVVEAGYDASDRQLARIRNLRNVLLISTLLIAVLGGVFGVVASLNPSLLPLCFGPNAPGAPPEYVACPTGDGDFRQPSQWDMVAVVLLGLLGGALAAAVSIRDMRGTATPYDIPVCLALLKVPTGALTAVGALIAIRGEFIPGLSALDSQEQILAYALVFGYAQQLLTGSIDRRARSIMDNLAGPKDPEQKRPQAAVAQPASTTSRPAVVAPTTSPGPPRATLNSPTPPPLGVRRRLWSWVSSNRAR